MTLLHVGLTGWVVVLVALTLVWAVSVRRRDASIVDICWGPTFALLSWVYFAVLDANTWRPLLMVLLVTVWGVRLSAHIHWRHRGKGEDPRYRAMRAARGPAFWWQSLFVVFWLQATLAWFIAMPVLAAIYAAGPDLITPMDVAGVVLVVIGFTFETVADWQLTRFKADPSSSGHVLQTGLWRYSRHPNYFGDALLWWGLYIVACSTPGGWWTLASPIVMTWLLLRVSGVTLLERSLRVSKPGYADYAARTSAFIPWFPSPGRTGD